MSDPVLIAGGGIGGLAAALALAGSGIASRVLERRASPAEEGAGIQLGPNGTRILRKLGIARKLEPLVAVPEALRIMSAKKGTEITRLPLGRWIEARHGAPYWTAHRHDLHGALLAEAEKSAFIDIAYGETVTGAEQKPNAVSVRLESGGHLTAPVLIGADGLWSAIRREVMAAEPPVFMGKIAVRSVIPAGDLEESYRKAVHIWLAPGAHVVHYPVRGGSELALVVILDGDDESTEWAKPLSPAELATKVARLALAEPLLALLAKPAAWRLWSLQGLRRAPPFAKGRIALLGDSAHPVLPFLAQGAVLALEDADTLASALRGHASPEAALTAYAAIRAPRAARVTRASAMNGRIYHLEGPAAAARNLVLGAFPGSRIIAGLDWLYGFGNGEQGQTNRR